MISWQFDLHCDSCASLQFALLPWECKVEQGRYAIMMQLESCTSLPIARRSSTTRRGKDTTPWVLPFPSHSNSSFLNMGMEAKKGGPGLREMNWSLYAYPLVLAARDTFILFYRLLHVEVHQKGFALWAVPHTTRSASSLHTQVRLCCAFDCCCCATACKTIISVNIHSMLQWW
jgi:hypothetical protein